jgi:myosin-crossreactive antigen
MFGFETWHSVIELRRYLVRFLRLFPDLETMQTIRSTRYSGYPGGHFKLLHLWPGKLLQAGRFQL